MTEKVLGVAILGCGNIAKPYARDLIDYPHLRLMGVFDVLGNRAESLAEEVGCPVYPSFESVLSDPAVDIVVNLTVHHAHYDTTRALLLSGKNVHSEKPMAMRYEQARELVDLASASGLRLSVSPFTLMGEAQQTAWKMIREGQLGTVRVAYAEVNWGRVETWHPSPQSFYEVGALYDVGVYPLAILTGIFGPARRVRAYGAMLKSERVTLAGETYQLAAPDWTVTMLEMGSAAMEQPSAVELPSPLVRLTTSFYVTQKTRQTGLEFHGDVGSLYLENWVAPGSKLYFAPFGEEYRAAPLVKEPESSLRWGSAVAELGRAMIEGRPHRNSAEQAAHVVEILNAAQLAASTGQAVEVVSTFEPPAPMEWAR